MPGEVFGEIENIRDADGQQARPASDEKLGDLLAFGHASGTADVAAEGPTVVGIDASSFPVEQITVLVDPTEAATATIKFNDDTGAEIVRRGPEQDGQYASDDGSQIYAVAAAAAPWIEIEIEDASEAANNAVSYSVMVI